MTRSILSSALCAMLFALCPSSSAQQPAKTSRIAYLGGASPAPIAYRTDAFRQRLRELGYMEGKNVIFEFRFAHEKLDRLPALAAELVRLKVDVIATAGGTSTRAAQEATASIPIVMVQDNDPVGNGFVASLARPGRNITGLATLAPEISGKRLELLKDIVPGLSRVAAFGTSTNPGDAQSLKEAEVAAGKLGLTLLRFDVRRQQDIDEAFRAATKERVDAVAVLVSVVLNSYRQEVVGLAVKNRLPVIYPILDFVEAGGLMSYGVSFVDLHRRAAEYVDKILKGSYPANLPVEQPTKFEFVINLRTAKQIGLTIPPNVLARADRIIR